MIYKLQNIMLNEIKKYDFRNNELFMFLIVNKTSITKDHDIMNLIINSDKNCLESIIIDHLNSSNELPKEYKLLKNMKGNNNYEIWNN